MSLMGFGKKARSLRTRILTVSLLVATLVLGVSCTLQYSQSMDTLTMQYQQTAINMLAQMGDDVERLLLSVESKAVQLQFNASLQNVFLALEDSGDGATAELDGLRVRREFLDNMREYLRMQNDICALFVMDAEGDIWGTSRTRTLSQDNNDFWLRYYQELYAVGGQTIRPNVGRTSSSVPRWVGGYMDTDFAMLPASEYFEKDSTPVLLCARRISSGVGLQRKGIISLAIPGELVLGCFDDFLLPCDNICLTDADGIQLCGTDSALNGSTITADIRAESTFYRNERGVKMHLINIELDNGLRLMCMVPMTYYQHQMQPLLYTMFVTGLGALLVLCICCVAGSAFLARPLRAMLHVMDRAGRRSSPCHGDPDAHMDEDSSVLEYKRLGVGFNRMLNNIDALTERNIQIEREKGELEMEALQAQINPHFLFNTITSIRWIAVMTRADGIASALTSLSQLFRPLFYNTSDVWTISDEFHFIQNYISLMEMRFGNQVDFRMNVQDEAMTCPIPRFILQPILENSYEHATRGATVARPQAKRQPDEESRAPEHTVIHLHVSLETAARRELNIVIQDNGQGIDAERLSQIRKAMLSGTRSVSRSGSIGLANVYRRIKLAYGDMADMEIESNACSDAWNSLDTDGQSAPDRGVRVIIRIWE